MVLGAACACHTRSLVAQPNTSLTWHILWYLPMFTLTWQTFCNVYQLFLDVWLNIVATPVNTPNQNRYLLFSLISRCHGVLLASYHVYSHLTHIFRCLPIVSWCLTQHCFYIRPDIESKTAAVSYHTFCVNMPDFGPTHNVHDLKSRLSLISLFFGQTFVYIRYMVVVLPQPSSGFTVLIHSPM